MAYRKEAVTKDKLREYIRLYQTIKIIAIKNRKPIFILKALPRECQILGLSKEIIIHKGNFIRHTRRRKSNKKGSKTISDTTPPDVNYPDKFRKARPSQEFSISSVLDYKIKMKDKQYITPIRDFLREYHILKEKRGKKEYKDVIAERNNFIIQKYKEICKKTGRKTPLPLKSIQNKLLRYGQERIYFGSPKGKMKQRHIFRISEIQIRRVIENNIKK